MAPEKNTPPNTLTSIHEVAANTFIFEKHAALDASLCDAMLKRFEAAQDEQYEGLIGQQQNKNQSIKHSTDLTVSGKPQWKDVDQALFQSLAMAMKEFRSVYPYFKGPFKDMGYAIQRTEPGQYYHWHIDGGSHSFSYRQLVAVWYLNDVPGPGGETEFLFQQLKIRPQRGKLLLFPPFWTHEHRGVTLQSGLKYIATTWVVFS